METLMLAHTHVEHHDKDPDSRKNLPTRRSGPKPVPVGCSGSSWLVGVGSHIPERPCWQSCVANSYVFEPLLYKSSLPPFGFQATAVCFVSPHISSGSTHDHEPPTLQGEIGLPEKP